MYNKKEKLVRGRTLTIDNSTFSMTGHVFKLNWFFMAWDRWASLYSAISVVVSPLMVLQLQHTALYTSLQYMHTMYSYLKNGWFKILRPHQRTLWLFCGYFQHLTFNPQSSELGIIPFPGISPLIMLKLHFCHHVKNQISSTFYIWAETWWTVTSPTMFIFVYFEQRPSGL